MRATPWSRLLIAAVAAVLTLSGAHAQESGVLAHYEPGPEVSGSIRIWGDDAMGPVVKLWEQEFQKRHEGIHFETKLMGTETGMAGLYAGVADLALLGREITPVETMAFTWVFQYKPTGFEVATGSLTAQDKSPALAVLVNRDNPIGHLTLPQLDAIFGVELRRGAARPIRTWGDLGLTGEWANKSVHAYARDVESETAAFFRVRVLGGSRKWDWDKLKEFSDKRRPDGSVDDADRQIALALANDPFGIAIGNLRYADSKVKPIALADRDSEPYLAATVENLVSRQYPLTRAISAYINRAPDQPVDRKVGEFLRYILSAEGQQDVIRAGDYLPLNEQTVRTQLERLGFSAMSPERATAMLDPDLPEYHPIANLSGLIRSVGADGMADVMKKWVEDFTSIYPNVHFSLEATGSAAVAVPALTTGSADIAPISREALPSEMEPFERKFGYPPSLIEVAGGAYRTLRKTPALVFYVNRINPIDRLSLTQLDAIMSTTRRRGGAADITTWGQVGLQGGWAAAPIHVYGIIQPNGVPNYLALRILQGGEFKKSIKELSLVGPGSVMDLTANAVAGDPYAISYGGIENDQPNTKIIALAESDAGPFYFPTFDAVTSRQYALSRPIYIAVNRPPDGRMDPAIREFLKFILSRRGQRDVVNDGVMLPLSATAAGRGSDRLQQTSRQN